MRRRALSTLFSGRSSTRRYRPTGGALRSRLGLSFLERFLSFSRRFALLPFALLMSPVGSVPVGVLHGKRVLPSRCRTGRFCFRKRSFRRDLAVTRTRRWVATPTFLSGFPVHFARHPQPVQQDSQLPRHRRDGFFAFFPPRAASFKPHRRRSVSGPRHPKIQCAPCTSSLRRYRSPSLGMRNSGWRWPDSLRFGRKPT